MSGCNFGDRDSGWLIALLVLDCECDRGVVSVRVCGGMAVRRIYRFESGWN
jgi:hypothetical protein